MTDAQAGISEEITWEIAVPLVTNRYIMGDLFMVWGITGGGLALIALVIAGVVGELHIGIMAVGLILAACAGIWLISVLVMAGVYRNRFTMQFRVDTKGASYAVSTGQHRVNTAIVIIGALAGKPGVAGVGMLAKGQETACYSWTMLQRADFHPAERVIVLRNSWRTVTRLFCTKDNYATVAAAVTEYMTLYSTGGEDA